MPRMQADDRAGFRLLPYDVGASDHPFKKCPLMVVDAVVGANFVTNAAPNGRLVGVRCGMRHGWLVLRSS